MGSNDFFFGFFFFIFFSFLLCHYVSFDFGTLAGASMICVHDKSSEFYRYTSKLEVLNFSPISAKICFVHPEHTTQSLCVTSAGCDPNRTKSLFFRLANNEHLGSVSENSSQAPMSLFLENCY